MQTNYLPISICDKIEQFSRNFIWGSSCEHRKPHLIAWGEVCQAKCLGGLGLRRVRECNEAFLLKLAWGLISHPQALWVQVLRSKYRCGASLFPVMRRWPGDSNLWKGVCAVWSVLMENIHWQLGNGLDIKFWGDKWICGMEALQNIPEVSVPPFESNLPVASYVTNAGSWDFAKLHQYLPATILQIVLAIPPPSACSGEDIVVWNNSPSGEFSVRSAYQALTQDGKPALRPDPVWKFIWRWPAPERVRTFLWLVAKEKLLTNSHRQLRGLAVSDLCPRCGHSSESVIHVLRDCNSVKYLWLSLLHPASQSVFFALPIKEWLVWNATRNRGYSSSLPWPSFFSFLCWLIWLNRNKLVFEGTAENIFAAVYLAQARTREFVSAQCFTPGSLAVQQRTVEVGWIRPPSDWIKCNTDGAVRQPAGAGCGGVFRDGEGNWLFGFSRFLGGANVLMAELWGLWFALKWAVDKGWDKICFEMDSVVAVRLVSDGCNDSHPCQPLLRRIHGLLSCVRWFRVTHIFREANAVADALASLALSAASVETPELVFQTPPPACMRLVWRDLLGRTVSRTVRV